MPLCIFQARQSFRALFIFSYFPFTSPFSYFEIPVDNWLRRIWTKPNVPYSGKSYGDIGIASCWFFFSSVRSGEWLLRPSLVTYIQCANVGSVPWKLYVYTTLSGLFLLVDHLLVTYCCPTGTQMSCNSRLLLLMEAHVAVPHWGSSIFCLLVLATASLLLVLETCCISRLLNK